jgi:hypothetical protein
LPAGCRWRLALAMPAMPAMPPASANFYLGQLAGRVRRLANGLRRVGWGAVTGWRGLRTLDVPDERIHFEFFGPAEALSACRTDWPGRRPCLLPNSYREAGVRLSGEG